ncbi:hypothetical protein LRS74_16440 [Streptomyces sp. LX-29]|uniref:zf-HC2 domain-containing protein n=1 Tax=Streptomyces sp. LX-29 TaxID=2900152 RepID=UPI00240D05AB|nr:zf-HC2 domain-containing protein [Streptomyces sp. LX-29]WFB08462.1 hypothetical protein LRS74_16440 [Streptomyces sp. LX-29]
MTSTTDTDEHPEVAEISAMNDGLLSPTRAADLRKHLEGCELCADVRTSLDEIRSLLGTLPGPVRMPADIAGRIDAALAAEALLDATAPETHVDVSRETPTSTADRGSVLVSRETSRETSRESEHTAEPAPKVVESVPPTATTATTATASDRPAGRPRAASGPGRQTSRPGGPRRGRRWPRVLLGTACAAAVLGVGSLFLPSSSDDGRHKATSEGDTRAEASGSPALSSSELESQVRQLLAGQQGGSQADGTRGLTTKESSNAPLQGGDLQVPSCIQAGTGRAEMPLAAQQRTYDGSAAYLVVLPHPADSARVDAFVIDASCVGDSPASAGRILVTGTFKRG